MFKNQIYEMTKPSNVCPYPDEREKYSNSKIKIKFNFLEFILITEDSSGFESIIKEMNTSQMSIERVKILKCENLNCKTAFLKYENCLSCKRIFCENCLAFCETCGQKCCKFCFRIDYSKFKDLIICPNC